MYLNHTFAICNFADSSNSWHHGIYFLVTDCDCKRTPSGVEYRGDRNIHGTEEAPCQNWSDSFTDEDMKYLHHSEDFTTMQDKCRMMHPFKEYAAGPICMLKDYPYFADCGIPYCGNRIIFHGKTLSETIWGITIFLFRNELPGHHCGFFTNALSILLSHDASGKQYT